MMLLLRFEHRQNKEKHGHGGHGHHRFNDEAMTIFGMRTKQRDKVHDCIGGASLMMFGLVLGCMNAHR